MKLRVTRINDFLYTYEANIRYEPRAQETISPSDMLLLGGVASAGCENITKHANQATELVKPFTLDLVDGEYPSKPLAESQRDWDKLEPEYFALQRNRRRTAMRSLRRVRQVAAT